MLNIKLSKLQRKVLLFFAKNNLGKNFYWTGGTVLSYLYLHHRNSVDLDFFSKDLFRDDEYLFFINALKKDIGAGKISLTLKYNRRLYLIEAKKEQIKLEMVYFPFASIENKTAIPEFSIKADSLTDIMTNKTLSAYQRDEVKDVFDLYRYLSANPKHNLIKLVSFVDKKFGIAIEPALLLAKINELIGDIDVIFPLLLSPEKDLAKKMKDFFQNQFNILAKRKIK